MSFNQRKTHIPTSHRARKINIMSGFRSLSQNVEGIRCNHHDLNSAASQLSPDQIRALDALHIEIDQSKKQLNIVRALHELRPFWKSENTFRTIFEKIRHVRSARVS